MCPFLPFLLLHSPCNFEIITSLKVALIVLRVLKLYGKMLVLPVNVLDMQMRIGAIFFSLFEVYKVSVKNQFLSWYHFSHYNFILLYIVSYSNHLEKACTLFLKRLKLLNSFNPLGSFLYKLMPYDLKDRFAFSFRKNFGL